MTSPSKDNHQAQPVCPICAKEAAADYAPFCSKRCADIDLHRWLVGVYAIPAVEEDPSVDPEEDNDA